MIKKQRDMEVIGTYVIYLVVACAVLGAVASVYRSDSGLGKEFLEGLYSIGPIFVPVAGIMASVPYLSAGIRVLLGPLYGAIGADPAIAATTVIAVDMGGYPLAKVLAASTENWIMAMVVGTMAGATIVFSIPVGLAMLEKRDHPYMALGIMSGILSVPIGVLVTCALLIVMQPVIRTEISTSVLPSYALALKWREVFPNLIPLVAVVIVIASGLRFVPNMMIKGFLGFGRVMDGVIRLVLVGSIAEYFTGVGSRIFGVWGFDPIIADQRDPFRALEIAGYIGVMLSGAFPMVYLLRRYLDKPLRYVGSSVGLSAMCTTGLLAAVANILAMFRLVKDMDSKEKVLCIAFAVCAAFLFGDHLAFTANFQPTLVIPIMIGKLTGGICGLMLAYWISVPKAEVLAQTVPIRV